MPNVDVDDLDSHQAKSVADCLFYCINWFREVISGFVTQPSKNIRSKVIKRLEVNVSTNQVLELIVLLL